MVSIAALESVSGLGGIRVRLPRYCKLHVCNIWALADGVQLGHRAEPPARQEAFGLIKTRFTPKHHQEATWPLRTAHPHHLLEPPRIACEKLSFGLAPSPKVSCSSPA